MNQIVYGAVFSHSPLMFVPQLADIKAAASFRVALEGVHRHLRDAKPDVLVLFYPDHFRQFRLDNMPTFSLGLRSIRTLGDWYLIETEYSIDRELAIYLLEGLVRNEFDMAFRMEVLMDHGGAQPLQVLDIGALPVIPIAINTAAPPLPSLRRCYALGAKVAELLVHAPGSPRRIAVIGSGGLSHAVPMARWSELEPSDSRWPIYVSGISQEQLQAVEAQRVASVVGKVGTEEVLVNEALDRQLMSWMEEGAVAKLFELDPQELQRQGGNGMNEVRSWLAAWGSVGGVAARPLYYQGIPEWLTGMGVMEFSH